MRTIEDRLHDHPALDALSGLNASVEHALYVEMRKGRKFTGDLATSFYQGHGISAKNLDHIHLTLTGRLDSVRECANDNVVQLKRKIAAKRKDISRQTGNVTKARNALAKERAKDRPDGGVIVAHLRKRDRACFSLHQHNRRLDVLEKLLAKAEKRAAEPTLCFGSRGLLRKRANIDNSDTAAVIEWRSEWDRRRHLEVFVPGTARASHGNEFVRLEEVDDGWNLVLRLPKALEHLADRVSKHAGYEIREVVIGTVRFPHGGDALRQTLADHASGYRSPVTWRIQRHERGGWKVLCTFQERLRDLKVTDFSQGALGVDFNADHLAVSLTDGRGCHVRLWTFPLDTRGSTSEQNLDACRKVALEIARLAARHHVPVVAESLDFSKKKAEITAGMGPVHARMLHSLAYSTFAAALDSACLREGVLLRRVNSAYTSIIGFAKHANVNGLGVHHAAAVAIARRGQEFSERVPVRVGVTLTAGVHGTLDRPVRIGRRHVWTQWAAVARQRKANVRVLLRERNVASSGDRRKAVDAGRGRSTGHAGAIPPPASTGLWGAVADGQGRAAA